MSALIDTHCHLHRAEFDADREEVIGRALSAGVAFLLDPATDFESNRTVIDLARRYPEVSAAVGVHPHHAGELDGERLKALTGLAGEKEVAAIGEIGLDYYKEFSPRDAQKEALEKQLRLARGLGKPVILHCRDAAGVGAAHAYADLFAILRRMFRPPIPGVLHCFSGGPAAARQALELGLYLSFAGNLTFQNAEALRKTALEVPLDRVLLETDSPFLAARSRRGRRNEPAFLPELVETWAGLLDLRPEDVARTTTVNARHLFGIGPEPAKGKITYPIRDSLYVNLTNACTDRCVFCSLSVPEFWKGEGTSPFVKGHHLRITKDPSVDEVLAEVQAPERYEEIVFCGYGEPVLRLDALKEVARRLKARGARKIRLNTNGHANLIHRRSVAPELRGLIDEVSVSLNTPNAQQYLEICRPVFGLRTYEAIKDFIRECRDAGIAVTATVVAMEGVDVEACRRVAEEELKVAYRVRAHNDVG